MSVNNGGSTAWDAIPAVHAVSPTKRLKAPVEGRLFGVFPAQYKYTSCLLTENSEWKRGRRLQVHVNNAGGRIM